MTSSWNHKRTPTYRSWECAIQRCHNHRHMYYKDYGARGISVCDRWRGVGAFKNFLEDMGERPEGMTLDRKDVNKGYSKSNCKWSTLSEQNKNRRSWKGKNRKEKLYDELFKIHGINI